MTRTLITGVAGFTGRYLAKLLAGRGHEVHGLVHIDPSEPVEGLCDFHAADLADLSAVRHVIAEVRPEQVVHLAAIAFVAHEDVGELYRSNIVGNLPAPRCAGRFAPGARIGAGGEQRQYLRE